MEKRAEDRLYAFQARATADSTRAMSNHIFKAIKENSKEGLCWLEWGVQGHSQVLIEAAVAELKSLGYGVKFNYNTDREYAAAVSDNPREKILVSITITW